jgi:hypothetical protein
MKFSLPLVLTSVSAMIGGASSCLQTYPLVAGGGNGIGTKAGTVYIQDDGDHLSVVVSSGTAGHVMYSVHAEAQCDLDNFPLTNKGNPKVGQMEINMAFQGGTGFVEFDLAKPDCGEAPILVGVHAVVEAKSGIQALDLILPQPVEYKLSKDAGSDEGASFFDTKFKGESFLSGLVVDGYCVDVEHTISTKPVHEGTAYSYLDPFLANTNIVKPENLDLVAWVINHFAPGDLLVDDAGIMEPHILSSGTLQRAIWYITDEEQATAGLGKSWSDDWAQHIADQAMENDFYEPGCDDLVPIVLVPVVEEKQHTIIQVRLAELGIPCDVGGGGLETAWAAMPGMIEPLGFQFHGSNWFTYVEFNPCM